MSAIVRRAESYRSAESFFQKLATDKDVTWLHLNIHHQGGCSLQDYHISLIEEDILPNIEEIYSTEVMSAGIERG